MHMSDQLTLSAEARERAGKGASRDLRRNGRVPAVIYGDNQEPVMIHVEEKALNKLLGTGYLMNSVVMVDVGGKAARTLPKDRSEEHTSALQSLMRNSYDVFCLKKKKK